MFEREEILQVLSRRLQGKLPADELERLAAEISGDLGEWVEVDLPRNSEGHVESVRCADICCFVHEMEEGGEFRLLRRKEGAAP